MRAICLTLFLACFALLSGNGLAAPDAADPFAQIVRTTEPLSPEAERQTFRLPEGFAAQLVVAEPDIAKPMNMAFDARGRLWVTVSREYPFPVTNGVGRDTVMVLSDFGADGRAKKIETFAEGLNIPIAVLPYKDGCIVWSIPNIWFLRDTDGDGRADKREILFGPLGWEKDTHGNFASFRRGFDGWIYGTHGFNNTSTMSAKDGSRITMQSGNTYRFRPDGSRVEQFTFGQVNPFGLAFDAWGNLYSADCHSSPIYQLLRGAYYPSFGKPHDGLGFAPVTIQHSHGSTAIAGITYISDPSWPADLQDNILIGNVMTSRINRDHIEFDGTSPRGVEQSDFLTSTDPWFRPVDIQFGPDGALYVADFYNRIIGHYEVPLTHPGRDRERGRIWRIVPKTTGEAPALALPSDIDGQLKELASTNPARRMLAMNTLADRGERSVLSRARTLLKSSRSTPESVVGAMWVVERSGGLEDSQLTSAMKNTSALVRSHVLQILDTRALWSESMRAAVVRSLNDEAPTVQRSAAVALSSHASARQIVPVLEALQKIDAKDAHLRHVLRMSLRDQLASTNGFAEAMKLALDGGSRQTLAGIALAIPTENAADFLVHHLETTKVPREFLTSCLQHAARWATPDRLDAPAMLSRRELGEDPDAQLGLFQAIRDGLDRRGVAPTPEIRNWGTTLATRLWDSATDGSNGWNASNVEGMTSASVPWFRQQRKSSDGDTDAWFLCSLPPGGEKLTGVMRSPTFAAPAKMSFFIAGHDGFPANPAKGVNVVRLRHATTLEILQSVSAPRNDVARPVSWDLSSVNGQPVFVEIVDADNGQSYAWIAAGRFEPAVMNLAKVDPLTSQRRRNGSMDLMRFLAMKEKESVLAAFMSDRQAEPLARATAARLVLGWNQARFLQPLLAMSVDATESIAFRESVAQALLETNRREIYTALTPVLKTAPDRWQQKLAEGFAAQKDGATVLLDAVAAGQASARVLTVRTVRDRLLALGSAEIEKRLEELTKNIGSLDEAREKLIAQRRLAFTPGPAATIGTGKTLFQQTCAVCHQIGGTGGVVGPQLDGVGNRGAERLIEDILDPNRNVDHAFYTTLLVLDDGEVVSGLLRREEGATIVIADSTGKEVTVPSAKVKQRRESPTSLMPDNFGDVISPADFNALVSYLLSTGSRTP
ncbi:MAG TPA: PVC-type heme-binding CxxCH protein [Roseimicrobium sp.]|nr:PVC-type heme-binding CxxCH protein [Roseimicrobium sp.]